MNDAQHAARYCKPTQVGVDGKPTSAAFLLRERPDKSIEGSLSAYWLEHVGDDANASNPVANVHSFLHTSVSNDVSMSANGCLAILNVGRARAAAVAADKNSSISFQHLPRGHEVPDPHCGITNLPHPSTSEALAVAQALAKGSSVAPAPRIRRA